MGRAPGPPDWGERYLLAEDLVARVAKEVGWRVAKQLGAWTGAELAGLTFEHPFLERRLPAVLADYVTLEQGSGIVHTAPGHGAEDFETGRKYGIEIYCPVDAAGRFTEGPFAGESIWDANPEIIQLLPPPPPRSPPSPSRSMIFGLASQMLSPANGPSVKRPAASTGQ